MRAFTIRYSDVARCPLRSLSPSHYRQDGTCLCVEEVTGGDGGADGKPAREDGE